MSTVLPNNILKCMSPTDRKALGKAGWTADECLAKAEVTNESQLQKQIVGYLRTKGIEPIVSSMRKRTTNNLGTPDLLFSFCGEQAGHTRIFACAFEVKMPGKKLEPHQEQMRVRLSSPPNSWTCRTITRVDDVVAYLRERGVL